MRISFDWRRSLAAAAMLIVFALASTEAAAQAVPQTQPPARPQPLPPNWDEEDLQPDRPDVTNGTHIIPIGRLQLEFGGQWARVTSTQRSFGSPVTARVGLFDWLEARVGTDGIIGASDIGTSATGLGNVQLGVKLRLWADPGGMPVLSILPSVNLPVASVTKGLGSGDPDFTVTFLTGTDLTEHSHIDINYGIGTIGAGPGRRHFTQHLVSASASRTFGVHANPYAELFWFSKQDPDGSHVITTDFGMIYTLTSRLALDGGIAIGLSNSAQQFSAFGGVSVIVGDVLGTHGVHARQRSAEEKAARRGARPKK